VLRALQDAQDGDLDGELILEKYRVTRLYHNRYDRVRALPSNFAVLGDALMRLNPAFGQGCAKAGQDATTLDALLRAVPYNNQGTLPRDYAMKLIKAQTRRNRGLFDSNRWNGASVQTLSQAVRD
jgi:2-polyprenyl-6-methoxyphenol hydroxylase-like FAD-dependent oxidoreductase